MDCADVEVIDSSVLVFISLVNNSGLTNANSSQETGGSSLVTMSPPTRSTISTMKTLLGRE